MLGLHTPHLIYLLKKNNLMRLIVLFIYFNRQFYYLNIIWNNSQILYKMLLWACCAGNIIDKLHMLTKFPQLNENKDDISNYQNDGDFILR